MQRLAGGLPLIRHLVSQGQYDWSQHVDELLEQGKFDQDDLEACVGSGKVIKTERDLKGNSVGNKVYVITGRDTRGRQFYTAGKIVRVNGLFYFFITAHKAR